MVKKECYIELGNTTGVAVIVKRVETDSLGQDNLICNILDENGNIVYHDCAWIIGTQPFEFDESELEGGNE